jgi:hypothetical protein
MTLREVMKKTAWILAAFVVAASGCRSRSRDPAAAPEASKPVTKSSSTFRFGHASMPVGTIVEHEKRSKTAAVGDAGETWAKVTWQEEIRASDGTTATKIALSGFTFDPPQKATPGGAPLVLIGKTIVVDTAGAGSTAVEVGAPLTTGESFGLFFLLSQGLSGALLPTEQSIAIGDHLPALAETLASFVSVGILPTACDLRPGSRVALESIRSGPSGDEGVFRAHLELSTHPRALPTGPPGDPKRLIYLTIDGSVTLRRRDSWLTRIELAGPVLSQDPLDAGGVDAAPLEMFELDHRLVYR